MLALYLQHTGGDDQNAEYRYVVAANRDVIERGTITGHQRTDPWWKLVQLMLEQREGTE